jgi:hypothetical protein
MSHEDDLNQLIEQQRRRWQKLQEQRAVKGINTPPEVLIEIEDIEVNLAGLPAAAGICPDRTMAAAGARQVDPRRLRGDW